MDDDKRQAVLEQIDALIKSGEPLTESDVKGFAALARDVNLLLICRESLKEQIPDPDRMSALSKLQNFVERHELNHPNEKNPLEEMGAAWKRALEVAAKGAADGAQA